MSATGRLNPFAPGPGLPPPYLAGREPQQKLLNGMLDNMAAGKPVSVIVIYGPRGMGKTVMLRWLKDRCVERKFSHVVGDPATMLGSAEALALKMLARPLWLSGLRVSLSLKWLSANVDSPDRDTTKATFLAERLAARCRKKPMVVLLDEAHAPSHPDALRLLLNVAQQVAQEARFLLVLAGTPRLTETLRNAQSTFIERAETIGLGALDKEASAAALRIPLEKDGITITENALTQVVEDSQCYPFFIQQWGEALWNHAKEKQVSELTPDDVNLALTGIQTKRSGFYGSRYRAIIEQPELLIAVDALVRALLVERRELDEYSVIGIIKSSLSAAMPDDTDIENKAREIMRGLIQHDFFWHPPESDFMAPGIPSFMTYLRNRPSPPA